MELITGLLIPFIGTTFGSGMVFLMKNKMNKKIEKLLLGFAAGVMIAASVWSLLIPSIDMATEQGKIAWVPATIGFLFGVVFLLVLDSIIPHMHLESNKPEGVKSKLKKTTMLVLAVTLHNIPEGMAVGVTFAGAILGNAGITIAGAFALAIRNCNSKFSRGSNYLNAFKGRGNVKIKSFFIWNIIWNSRTNRGDNYNITYECSSTNITISTIICSRSNDLCSCRGINSRISSR